jgi:hypothetical protein
MPINPWSWSIKLGFDQAQLIEGHQRLLVCSGQDAVDADGNPQHPGDMAAQLEQAPGRFAPERPRRRRSGPPRPARVEDRQGEPLREDRRRRGAGDGARPDREPARARQADRMALARRCLGCGRLIESGSRCPACELRRPRGRRWQATRRQVLARCGWACVHCGAPATDVDHLIPIADGGDDSLANLRPACARCNRGRH